MTGKVEARSTRGLGSDGTGERRGQCEGAVDGGARSMRTGVVRPATGEARHRRILVLENWVTRRPKVAATNNSEI